jgi:HAE1 family hydrophobic/amphiphilic exporter-1
LRGWLYRISERGFDALLSVYEAGLKVALRHRFITLMVMLGTIVLTGYLYVIIPKGFFPQQDTGMILGIAQTRQDTSFQAMAQRMEAAIKIVLEDPPWPRSPTRSAPAARPSRPTKAVSLLP